MPVAEVGLLVLEYQASQTNSTEIIAPTWKISVHPYNKFVEDSMIEFLADEHDIDIQNLNNRLSKWKLIISDNLERSGSTNVLNIGVYTKDTKNFVINPDILASLEKMNPNANFSNLLNDANFAHSKKVITKIIKNKPKKGLSIAKLTLLLLVIFCIIGLCWSAIHYFDKNKYDSITEVPVHVNKKPSSDSHDIAYEHEFEKNVDSSIDKTILNEEIEEKQDSSPIDQNLNTLQTPEYNICTIIVGSFKTLRGLNRMENKVTQDSNYNVVKMQYGEYTRIGFEIPCDDEKVINDIKNTYNSSAWLLE